MKLFHCPYNDLLEQGKMVCDDGALGCDDSVKQCPTQVFNKCQAGGQLGDMYVPGQALGQFSKEYQDRLVKIPEIDKVIKGLRICNPDFCTKERRGQCPYYEGPETDFWSNPDGYMCDYNLRHDAIKLLEVLPKVIEYLQKALDASLDEIMSEE